jgi:hypothetical protein
MSVLSVAREPNACCRAPWPGQQRTFGFLFRHSKLIANRMDCRLSVSPGQASLKTVAAADISFDRREILGRAARLGKLRRAALNT